MSLPLHAETDCPRVLRADQSRALVLAIPDAESIELFSREINGTPKIVAVVGERRLHQVLNGVGGKALFDAFDRTGFDYRLAGLNDRVLDFLAYKFAMLALKVSRTARVAWESLTRSKAREAEATARFRLMMEQLGTKIIETPPPNPTAAATHAEFVKLFDAENDPFSDPKYFTQRRFRKDLPEFLKSRIQISGADLDRTSVVRPSGKLLDLERSHRPGFFERLSQSPITLYMALSQVPLIAMLTTPDSVHRPILWATLGLVGYQTIAILLEPIKAQNWYQTMFPLQHPGERARNQVSIERATQALNDPAVSSLLIIEEERRVPDLVGRLIAGGFKSLSTSR